MGFLFYRVILPAQINYLESSYLKNEVEQFMKIFYILYGDLIF